MQSAGNGGPALTYRSAPIGADYLLSCGSMRCQQFNSAGIHGTPSTLTPTVSF